jgi:hypothetical protein
MKRFLGLIAAAGIMIALTTGVHAQNRNVGARTFTMDDGAGHTYTMQTPTGMTGNVTYTFPAPPTGAGPAGYVNVGTSAGQTLFWNGTTLAWEASSVITNNTNGNGTNVTITAPLIGAGATFTTVSATTFTGALTGHASQDLALAGGTMTGPINMGAQNITNAGSIAGTSLSVSGNITTTGGGLVIPTTTSSSIGTITQSGSGVIFHTFGSFTNLFIGASAGNFTLTNNQNVQVGGGGMNGLTSGNQNTGLGWASNTNLISGSSNVALGTAALFSNKTGSNNVAVGLQAGINLDGGSNNTFIGGGTSVPGGSGLISNSTAIGAGATVTANNSVQIGNASVTAVNTSGIVTAAGFVGPLTGNVTGHASQDLALTGGTMSGAINMGSHQINAVTDPTSAQDAATKAYVDAATGGSFTPAYLYSWQLGSEAVATLTAVTFNNTDASFGITLVGGNTITVAAAGVYSVEYTVHPNTASSFILGVAGGPTGSAIDCAANVSTRGSYISTLAAGGTIQLGIIAGSPTTLTGNFVAASIKVIRIR